jgi:hypothetical protein
MMEGGVNNLFISSRSLGSVQEQPKVAPSAVSERSPRFHYWLVFLLLSIIVAGSSIEATDRVQTSSKGIQNQKWAVICSTLSVFVAMGVVAMHFSPISTIILVGTKFEGAVCFTMVALWSSLVAVISDSSNGLAVDGEGSVTSGNLYYCGWGGFVCTILLFLNFLKEVYFLSINEELSLRSDRLNMWIAYLIVSIILTSSAANVFDHECVDSDRFGTMFCNRTLLALAIGGAGSACSIVIIGMKFATGMTPWGIELFLSVFLFLANCFSIGLVTAEHGPGGKIGNLYYFSWFSLILPFVIMSATFDYISKRDNQEEKDAIIDAYERPSAHSSTAANFNKSVPDYYASGAASIAPTEYSSVVLDDPAPYDRDSYATGYDGRAKNVYSDVDQRRQSAYSQGAETFFSDYKSEFGTDTQSSAIGPYTSSYDPTNFRKSGIAKGQSYASVMDSGLSYATGMDANMQKPGRSLGQSFGDSFSSGVSLQKPGKAVISSYDHDDSYGSAKSLQKPGKGVTSWYEYGDSFSSATSFQNPGKTDPSSYADEEQSYASGISLQKPGKTDPLSYADEEQSYASGTSLQEGGKGESYLDDSYSSEMELQKPSAALV